MHPSASTENSKAPQSHSGRFPRTKRTLSVHPPPSMQALWCCHFQDRQYSFLLCLPPASGLQQSQVCLDGTKGPQSISPRCVAGHIPPPAAPPSALFCLSSLLPTLHKTPTAQSQPKYQLSLAWQAAPPDLCSAHAPLEHPLCFTGTVPPQCHTVSPPRGRTGNEGAEGCEPSFPAVPEGFCRVKS